MHIKVNIQLQHYLPVKPKIPIYTPTSRRLKKFVPRFTQSKDFHVSLLVLGFSRWFTMCTKFFLKKVRTCRPFWFTQKEGKNAH